MCLPQSSHRVVHHVLRASWPEGAQNRQVFPVIANEGGKAPIRVELQRDQGAELLCI